jgi:AcrR family transcriptional regulator
MEELARADGRRTDTRRRIHEVALEVFTERGWESATLREIADRLGVTRPALYYHFDSKEDILASIYDEFGTSVDGILAWADSAPVTAQTRVELVQQLSALMTGAWGRFLRFVQRNDAAMRELKTTKQVTERLDALDEHLRPDSTLAGQIRARLALDALLAADSPNLQLGGTDDERTSAALEVAIQMVS